jgi:hypothetical protein
MSEPRGRPFAAGNTVGRGRPKGSLNKSVAPAWDLLIKYQTHLMTRAIDNAMKGDKSAMRLCLERIIPARPDPSIRLSLSKIKTVRDLTRGGEVLMKAIGRGEITPTDGERMMNIFQGQCRIVREGDWEDRLVRQEQRNDTSPVNTYSVVWPVAPGKVAGDAGPASASEQVEN